MLSQPQFFEAADGTVARIRIPGGRLAASDFAAIVEASEYFGDGALSITSRGNLQIRRVGDREAFTAHLAPTGLGSAHDVVASPLSEVSATLARQLAERLSGTPLPRRTLLGIDGGDGDIVSQRPDAGIQIAEGRARLLGDDELLGLDEAVDKLVARAQAGRIERAPQALQNPSFAPVGWFESEDGRVAVGGVTPLGMLPAKVARLLTVAEADITVTPWRSLIIHDLAADDAEAVVRVLAPLGVTFDDRSRWLRVTSCVGAPACGAALSDVRADAAQVEVGSGRVHFSGCARGCGRPNGSHTEYQATGDGEYEVIQRGM